MIIDLTNLGTHAKRVEASFDAAEIDLNGESVMLSGATSIDGEIERVDKRAFLRATMRADVSLDCTRCLEPVARHLEIPFNAIFVDAGDERQNAEAHLEGDDLDESVVREGRIDLAEVVREQILLAVPEQIFCRDDCKGLCPKCGSNLNLIDCKCVDDEIDPRWSALKNLK